MRYVTSVLVIALLAGCQSVRVIDVETHDAAQLDEINQRAKQESVDVTLTLRPEPFANVQNFLITDDSVRFACRTSGQIGSTALANVQEIHFGAIEGPGGRALSTGVAAGMLSGLAAAAWGTSCPGFCAGSPEGAVIKGTMIGAVAGVVLGAVIGEASARPGVIYRFREGTPEQIMIAIGANPVPVGTDSDRWRR